MSVLSLNLIVLRASDIEAAQRFYSLLGLAFTKHAHGSGPEHYAAECGAQVFEIYPQTSAKDSTRAIRFGFKVRELDAIVARLAAGGGKILSAPKDSPWGRRAVVADPIGHKIELVEESLLARPNSTEALMRAPLDEGALPARATVAAAKP